MSFDVQNIVSKSALPRELKVHTRSNTKMDNVSMEVWLRMTHHEITKIFTERRGRLVSAKKNFRSFAISRELRRVLDVHRRNCEVSVEEQRVDPPSWANSAHRCKEGSYFHHYCGNNVVASCHYRFGYFRGG